MASAGGVLIVFRCVVGEVRVGGNGEAAEAADGVYLGKRCRRADVLCGYGERETALYDLRVQRY